MKSTDKISTVEAIGIASEYDVSATKPTIISWCKKYKIGKQVGGRWYVNKKRLILMMEGKTWQDTQEEEKNQK